MLLEAPVEMNVRKRGTPEYACPYTDSRGGYLYFLKQKRYKDKV